MAITPEDKKISQFPVVAAALTMFVPLVDLTQLDPTQRNVRSTIQDIIALVDLSPFVVNTRQVATSGSLTGGGDLSANRTLSLVNDNASPGNSQYYGTNGSGTKGFFPLPSPGTGTVTSFSANNLSPLFTTNVATATTTPALSFSLNTQNANLVFAGPTNGAAAAPTFRSLVAADIPSLSSIYQPLNSNLTAISALTDPGADRILFWDDSGNTITWLQVGSGLQIVGTTLSSTGGGGSVTDFTAGDLSPLFTTNVATSTTTPDLTFSLNTQSANLVFAGPSAGGAAAPTFRALVAADIPDLSSIYDVAGSAATAESNANSYTDSEIAGLASVYQPLNANLTQISGLTDPGADRILFWDDSAGTITWLTAGTGLTITGTTITATGTGGTVTSVALTMPSGFSVGGSPVTTSGTLAVTTTLTGIVVGDGSGFLARTATGTADRISITNGSGVAGNPTFDIAATYVGQTSITTLGTVTTGTWSATTISASRGGTGQTTYADGDLLYGLSGGLAKLPHPGTLNSVLVTSFFGALQWVDIGVIATTTLTGTANQVLVNGGSGTGTSGAITLTLPQNIHTAATPQFAQIGLGGAAVGTHAIAGHSSTADIVFGNNGVQAFFPALAGRGMFVQRNGIAGSHLFSAAQTTTFVGVSTEGTLSAPTATGANRGTRLVSCSYDGTNYFVGGTMLIETTEAQTASARGSYVGWSTILTGATALAERARISGAGNFLVGTTSDPSGGPGKIKALGIEDTPIGASTQSTGSFTTLSSSIAGSNYLTVASTSSLDAAVKTSTGGQDVYFGQLPSSGGAAGAFSVFIGAERFRVTSTGINSTAIGATTPSTVAATTIDASGSITRTAATSTSPGIFVVGTSPSSQAILQVGTGAGDGGNVGARVVLLDAATGGKRWDMASGGVAAGTFSIRNSTDAVTAFQLTNTGINSTVIGATTPAAVNATNVVATTGSLRLQGYGGTAGAGAIFFGTGSTDYLYHDATSLAFRIGGSDRMVLSTTGINSTAIGATTPSTVRGTKLIGGGTTPGVSVAAGAGSGASANISGSDAAVRVTLTTGTGTSSGLLFTVTFASAFSAAPKVVFTPCESASADLVLNSQPYVIRNTTIFEFHVVNAPNDGTDYPLDFIIIG